MASGQPSPQSIFKEIANLPFEKLVSSPLFAGANAQMSSAMNTVHFLKSTAFKPGTGGDLGEPVYLDFSYSKGGLFSGEQKISIPLLTFVPLPTLRISMVSVSFNAKVLDIQRQNANMSHFQSTGAISGSSSTTAPTDSNKAAERRQVSLFSGGLQNVKTTSKGYRVQRDFNIKISVKANQEELPAGMSRLVAIMEQQIRKEAEVSALVKEGRTGMTATASAFAGAA
eukprot:CAMPEP_0177632296 /NCGR_PEP_ID=MMETSP0447-20121125/2213_1 /TAXON_ID=0 /ORGANISM="Stygamoeba regulata, Strain BSH-02190019" /LENGTH=226 /DNA_ID=CAMNT_0019133849 /DNA_START=75 /DNA_END=752 /DNA_ORIENTATION=-